MNTNPSRFFYDMQVGCSRPMLLISSFKSMRSEEWQVLQLWGVRGGMIRKVGCSLLSKSFRQGTGLLTL
jgi:hypothetical protein